MAVTTASKTLKKRITTKMGDFEYTQEELVFFENGLCGFENLRDFLIVPLPSPEIPEYYRYLQSLEEPNLSLIIMNVVFGLNGDGVINALDLDGHLKNRDLKFKETSVFVVTSIHKAEDKQRISVNTKAPLIVASQKQKGWQVVLDNPRYDVQHYLV